MIGFLFGCGIWYLIYDQWETNSNEKENLNHLSPYPSLAHQRMLREIDEFKKVHYEP